MPSDGPDLLIIERKARLDEHRYFDVLAAHGEREGIVSFVINCSGVCSRVKKHLAYISGTPQRGNHERGAAIRVPRVDVDAALQMKTDSRLRARQQCQLEQRI